NGDTETDVSAIEITVSFTNMDIADVADSVTVPGTNPDLRNSTEADKVLAYASFIYKYHYYEDTCGGVYTFYKADYLNGKGIAESEVTDGDPVSTGHEYSTGSDYVTMGLEIGTSVEFFDQSYTTPIGNDPYAAEFGFDAANYKPYVYSYKTRQIAVNPKAGNIDEGCGTYEDPYVITNARQLKSVYYYLKDKKEQLTNWQVNEIGDDTELCTKTTHAIKTYGDADFPAKEKMNQAYYLFKGDIDFSGFSDFVGFGTNADPFLGVFVGDDENRKILLPNTSTNNAVLDSFALVRYAKGCVVKDLTIQLGSYDGRVHTDGKTVYTDYIKVTTAGGGVFAYVQGGDNIIDNVTVKGTLLLGLSQVNTGATVGGYAGQVQLGTLIVRNLSEDALKEFRVEKCSYAYMKNDDERKAVASAEDKEAGSYLWIGGVVGRVQDGVLLYDGSPDTATKVFDETYLQTNHMYANTEGLEASPNFSMVNTTYLKSCIAGGNMKIAVYGSTLTDKQITLQPQNDGQLYIAAMALNSGCFTYEGRKRAAVTGTYYSGYDVDARYRNGDYSQVGVRSGNIARDDVIANDNINGAQGTDGEFFKPYLFDYVEFTADQKAAVLDGTKTDTPGRVSTLFTGLVSDSKDNYKTAAVRGAYHGIDAANNTYGIHANNFTIYLAEAVLYDMSDYKDSFRGVGALYYTNANRFKGNLIGAVSGSAVPEVKLDMHMNNETATLNAGLLNSIIVNTQTDSCVIRNLTVSGEVNITTSNADDETTLSGVRNGKNSVLDKSAGGVIGSLSIPSNISPTSYANGANYYFENVSAKDLKVRSLEYAGGLLGKLVLTLPETSRYTVVKFKDCQVGKQGAGEAVDKYNTDIMATADVGGLLGGYRHKLTMSFENCKAESVALETKGLNRYLYNGSTYYVIKPAAGGLIGRSFPREANSNSDYALTLNGCGFKKLNLKSIGHMGGAVGCNLANLTVTDFTGENIRFENTLSTESRRETSGENNDFMRYVGSFGGIVGYSATNSVSRTTITDAAIKDIAGTYHHGSYYSDDGRYETKTNIGGIAGALYSRAVLTDCTVGSTDTNIQIEAETVTASLSNDRVSVAGMVGRATGLTCTGCKVIGGNDSYLKGSDSAAGFAAYVYSSDSNADRTYYKNCSVQNLKLIANTKLGGMEAQRLGNAYSIFNGVTVKDCEFVRTETTTVITAAERSCGGLVAYTAGLTTVLGNGSADTGALVENVVTSGQTSDRVGGIVGYGAGNLSHVQGRYITVKNSTFIGRMAGLLAGSTRYNTNGGSEKKAEHITLENNKLIGYGINDNEYLYVGGLYGYGENFDYPFYGDDLTLKGNLIAGVHEGSNYRPNSYIGGLFGELNSRSFIENLSMEDNIISMLDYEGFRTAVEAKAAADGKTKSRVTTADYMAQDTFGIWNAGAVDAGKVESTVYAKLYKRTNALESYPALMTEAQLPDYAQRVGLLFGHHVSRYSIVTDLNLTYSAALRKYRPAVDVADNGATNLNNVFNYRSYYHIVYNDYEDVGMTVQTPTTSTAIKEAVENYTAPSGYTKSETYSFGQIEDIYKDYLAGVAGTKDARYTHHLEMNYKQQSSRTTDTAYSIGELYKYTYYDTESGKYQSPFVDGTGKVIPMAVFDISAVDDVNKWINTYVNLITNSGGTLNQNYGAAGLVTVTGHKMRLSDGVVSYLPGQNPCVTASGTTYSNTGLEFTVNSAGYDKQTNDTNGTFTLLHIEYTWNYPNTTLTRGNVTADTDTYTLSPQKHTIAIDVPVFLQKILEIDHHVTGIEGAEYYIENIYNKSSSNLNSSLQILQGMYTAYVEYDYSDAVEEYGSAEYVLSKEISFVQPQNETSYVQILKNTRITLIDIMDNNHVYYYTAETNRDSVKLSEFVDSASIDSGTLTYYKEPKISDIGFKSDLTYTLYHKHYMAERPDGTGVNYNANSRIAMQQYLVLVDTSKVNSNTEVSYAYKFRMNPCSAGYNGAEDTDVVRNETL
ncbi:MAG: hypothetical protein IJ711_10360, partial [Lachnospiraceae bacterium]|nr:hypothetical protein [Lachnospiraceae bacterium]